MVGLVNGKLTNFYSSSYRCGVFFAGDNPGDPPRFAIFVVPKRFPMNCDRDPEVIKAEAKKECFDLVR